MGDPVSYDRRLSMCKIPMLHLNDLKGSIMQTKHIPASLSLVAAITSLVIIVTGQWAMSGPVVITFFILFVLFLKTIEKFSGSAFTFVIFTAVSASLYYPELFTGLCDFQYKELIVPLLIIIMFGMGTSMSIKDFVLIGKMPKGVLIDLACQFSIMPMIGFGLATASGLPPEIAAGIVLVGCSPSGLASNVMAYISGANLALLLTLTAISTLLAPFITPFYYTLLYVAICQSVCTNRCYGDVFKYQ